MVQVRISERLAVICRESFSCFVQVVSAMKILVVGSGGREHALVWKLRQVFSGDSHLVCSGERRDGD
jgi:hypothetical protein